MKTDAIEVYLAPGGFHFGGGRTRIRTLLGSCVSITMWHPQRRIGGMCHYVLPEPGRRRGGGLDGRFADDALQLFLGEIENAGTAAREYEIKLFGGGRMLLTRRDEAIGIGARNIEAGRRLLRAHGLAAHRGHLAGVGHRDIVFDLSSGQVWVKHVVEARAA